METAIIVFFVLLSVVVAPAALFAAFMGVVILIGFIRMPYEIIKMKWDERNG